MEPTAHLSLEETSTAAAVLDWFEIASLLLFGYACHTYYNVVGHIASLRGTDFGPLLATPLDRAIAYTPFWVLFYQVAFFVPIAVLALVLARVGRNVHAVRRLCVSFLALLAAHYLVYLAFPTSTQAIAISPGDGPFEEMVRYQYRIATLWCAFPSLHVSASWFFYRVLIRFYPLSRWPYLVWFAGMCVSTVALKMHYVVDGAAGIAAAEVFDRMLYLRLERDRSCQWTWPSAAHRVGFHAVGLAAAIAGLLLAIRLSGFAGDIGLG